MAAGIRKTGSSIASSRNGTAYAAPFTLRARPAYSVVFTPWHDCQAVADAEASC